MAKKKQELTSAELLAEALVREEDWPYQVPANWVWVRLGSVTEIISKGTTPKGGKNTYTEAGVAFLRVENIDDNGIIDFSRIKYIDEEIHYGYLKRSILAEGDVLISIAGTLGRTAIVNKENLPMNTNQALAFIRLIDGAKISNRYIEKALSSTTLQRILLDQTKVTSIPNLTLEIISNCHIPLPPLAEQQRIVDRIESLFDKLDQAKDLIQEALDSFETRKAAILHQAFTGQLTKKWREAHGVGSESWEEKTLKDICKISSGGTPSRKVIEYYKGNIPWVKTGEIKWNYLEDSEEKITEEAINNSSAKLFPAGAVLVAMYGQGLTRGRASILNIDAATNQAVCALIPSETINNVFLYYYFMCNYWKFREMAFGGNQPNFSGTMISKFAIMLPKLKEQQEIVRILDDLFEKEHAAKDLCDQIDQIDTIKKTILGKAFRGGLGTNVAEEESAVELLERCL